MDDRFTLSWVGICRLFKLANKLDYKEVPETTYQYLYRQCSSAEKNKLKELAPELVVNLETAMKDDEYYEEIKFDGF